MVGLPPWRMIESALRRGLPEGIFCTAVFGSAGRKGGGLRIGRGVKTECGKIKSDREEVIE
jgi:hypothetical protein